MRSRLASVFTIVALVAGAGGAIAAGQSGSHNGTGGAAIAQYKPPKKTCGKGFHRVGGKCVKNGRKSKSGVKGQGNSRSRKGGQGQGNSRSRGDGDNDRDDQSGSPRFTG